MESEKNKEVAGFNEVLKAPLIDISNNDNNNLTTQSSTELWLIQCPLHQAIDLDNEQDLSLTLHRDGLLGNFKDSSGKSYDVVGLAAQNSNATVFLSSATAEPKMVGKISRHISLVHYAEPSEPHKRNESFEKQKQRSGKSLTNSLHHLSAPSQSVKPRSSKPSSTHSSRRKSSLSEEREPAKPKKRKPMEKHARSTGESTLDSGRGTSSGSLQHSNERKSKKNKKK